jgi:hypothetical protein
MSSSVLPRAYGDPVVLSLRYKYSSPPPQSFSTQAASELSSAAIPAPKSPAHAHAHSGDEEHLIGAIDSSKGSDHQLSRLRRDRSALRTPS